MRLDDIHAFIEAKRVHDRAYRRAFGDLDTDVQLNPMSVFREASTVTDRHIQRTPLANGSAIFKFDYQGVTFWHIGSEEVE